MPITTQTEASVSQKHGQDLLCIKVAGEYIPFSINRGSIIWEESAEQCNSCGSDLGQSAVWDKSLRGLTCNACGERFLANYFRYEGE